MADAWIYAEDSGLAGELTRGLAELGFSPRRVSVNGSLLPGGDDGGTVRRPALVIVAAAAGEPSPGPLVARLREHEDLCQVPLLAALDPEHVASAAVLGEVQELLVHPFACGELELRVARARREVNGVEDGDVVRAGSLELNVATYQVAIAGEPVSFTYMEYELLKFLMTHPGRVFSRESLLTAVWGYDYYGGARTVDVHVRRVRAKLGQEHAGRIKTIRSVGYRFEL
ncbi:MAG: winged helix-turn-helix domain-containing protein [Thermoleophilaceae bacterium]